jgi:hypothetical protein
VFYVRAPVHSHVAQLLKNTPQPVNETLIQELKHIKIVLNEANHTAPVRSLDQKELLGLMGVLMQFTAVLPTLRPYCQTSYYDVDRLYEEIVATARKKPLGLADQMAIAIRQSDGDIPEALWRLFITSRLYARWYDVEAITGLPKFSPEEVRERMSTWSRSVKALKPHGSCPDQDASGDTYYCWTHVLARVAYRLLATKQTPLVWLETKALEHGTMLNHKLAHRIKPQGVRSNHSVAALYGNAIGDECVEFLGRTT